MDKETRILLSKYLQETIHQEHLPGYYFSDEVLLEHINKFFEEETMIKNHHKMLRMIRELRGKLESKVTMIDARIKRLEKSNYIYRDKEIERLSSQAIVYEEVIEMIYNELKV